MASSRWVGTAISLPAADRKRIIDELTRGREVTDQLRRMLRETRVDVVEGLAGKILETFTRSLSMLCDGGDSDEVSQVPVGLDFSPSLKLEDSGESCKTPPAPKDRRGCYKRRRTSETWTKETPSLFEDGHAWRKYGQKVILHAKHPRNYFRCTHKFERDCQASKQVQKIQDDPPLFRTTYHGHHTCKDMNKSSSHHIIMDATTHDHSSIIWSFGSSDQDHKPHDDDDGLVINSETRIKQEKKEDNQIKSSASNREYFISPELTGFNHNSSNWSVFSSGSDHGDVYSCTASTHSMEMDMNHMIVDSINFDDFLELESLS